MGAEVCQRHRIREEGRRGGRTRSISIDITRNEDTRDFLLDDTISLCCNRCTLIGFLGALRRFQGLEFLSRRGPTPKISGRLCSLRSGIVPRANNSKICSCPPWLSVSSSSRTITHKISLQKRKSSVTMH